MFKNLLNEDNFALTLLFTLLSIVFILVPPLNETSLRIFFSLPWILFLPGYSLIRVLFRGKENLSIIEFTALSFALSFVVVSSLGLVLNYTPFGIRLESVFFILSIFTISLSLVSWVRRLELQAEERFSVPFDNLFKVKKLFEGEKQVNKVLTSILVASIIASSLVLVYVIAVPKIGEKFTEFYILGPNGKASDYPTDLTIGEEGRVIIYIVNHEYVNITYYLKVNFNGTLIHKERVFLIENERWKSSFAFKAIKKGEDQKLEFLLYTNKQTEAHRKLHLWVSVT